MTVLYDNKDLVVTPEGTIASPFEKFFNRVYKFKKLIPIFPIRSEEWDKYWYKETFITALGFAIFFYLLSLFFVYLGVTDREHITSFLLMALAWFIAGAIIPSGIYRLLIIILKKQKLID